MYRKRTVLLSSVSTPSKKPVGIAVVISDGMKTSVRASINDLWREGCFFAVKTDDVTVVKRLQNSNGFCFFIPPTLLERVRCCLLDENLRPLSYGDGKGGSLTRDFLEEIRQSLFSADEPSVPQTSSRPQSTPLTRQPPPVQQAEKETRLPPKGLEGYFSDGEKKTDDDFTTATATRAGKPLSGLSSDGGYDDFVAATKNFYERTPVIPEPLPQAKVNLAEYARALKEFYSSPRKGSYIESVGKELEKVFESYLPYLPLMKKIENSFFVKITDGKGRFFALGLLKEGNDKDYICYALPRTTSAEDGSLVVAAEEDGKTINFGLILQSCADGRVKKAS